MIKVRDGKMNKKGQALVEFIIILPVFIFMLLAMIDIGKILYFNNKIESKMDDVITMYENKYQYEVIKKSISKDLQNTTFKMNENEKYIEFILEKKVDIITPGLNLIFDNPYKINVKRVIYND